MGESLSIISLVNTILQQAVSDAASDVHFESQPNHLRVRFRIDGLLYDREPLSSSIKAQVLSRVKVLANMDVAQKRIPQDGKFTLTFHDYEIDFRVSSFPGTYGEKLVIRLLPQHQELMRLPSLGLSQETLQTLHALLKRQYGFLLVTGPTGSGKTTTLYAALSLLNIAEKNIITLEDPVEYNITGVTQGHIHPGAGFTFASGIRAMLRQDPDVVMVGEIRDKETARIAIEAALTGHLVLSTIHTNSAPGVVMRLMDMGIEPYLINASLTGALAQRLARRLCHACKQRRKPTDQEQEILRKIGSSVTELYDAKGCPLCMHLGYKGRVGIFELLVMTDALQELIVQHPSFTAIEKQALQDGMKTLVLDAQEKLQEGVISLHELMRILL